MGQYKSRDLLYVSDDLNVVVVSRIVLIIVIQYNP